VGEERLGREAIEVSCPVRVNIIVEGQTEETFVNKILAVELGPLGISISARSVETKRKRSRFDRSTEIKRGGLSKYVKAKGDIQRWLKEDSGAYLTTMFDLYALPSDFPKREEARRLRDPYEKVMRLEEGLSEDIDNPRFIPYIQLHEFEGLLFSDVEAIDHVLGIYQGNSHLRELRDIRTKFNTPEEIDEGQTTAPSKRLISLYEGYDKVPFGSLIAERIGLERIREECPHFGEWVSKILALAPQ
jgi:hypothetical protein